ncbi:MAG: hypothetical protein QG635_2331 [Bacteroidota bacterium]|nr:hypothetical protein [Bacteroidota bacterium]
MKAFLAILLFLSAYYVISAQDYDLLQSLEEITTPQTEYTYATFKGTRIITGQSIENTMAGQLEFQISHRFGRVSSGIDNFWGLDQSNIFISLEYGLTDWLELGIGRASNEKIINGFSKIKILRQSGGEKVMPVSLSYFASACVNSSPWDPLSNYYFTSRLSFVHQLLIARKLTEDLSMQLSPTMIHRNLVQTERDENDIYALGIGGRYKLANRVSINFEYFYVFRPSLDIFDKYKDPVSLGVDIETGGHVFQIMLSSSPGMIEKHYIADNIDDWQAGDIHLGFNISRVFTIFSH